MKVTTLCFLLGCVAGITLAIDARLSPVPWLSLNARFAIAGVFVGMALTWAVVDVFEFASNPEALDAEHVGTTQQTPKATKLVAPTHEAPKVPGLGEIEEL